MLRFKLLAGTFSLGRASQVSVNNTVTRCNRRASSVTLSQATRKQTLSIWKQTVRQATVRRRSLTLTPLDRRFKMEWPRITLFGDSITRRSFDVDNGCWASMIAHQVGDYFNVDPRGFDGYNSKWALDLMPNLFPRSYLEKVEIFTIFYGHNDSLQPPFPTSVPVDEYEKNMLAIVEYLGNNGLDKSKILLITPTWFHEESFKKLLKETGFPETITTKSLESAKEYSDVVLKIAQEKGIDVVNFFEVSRNYEPLEDLFYDGVHFSRLGARLLYDNLMPVIEKKIEKNLGRPLKALWHVIPFEQHPEVKPVIDAHKKMMLENQEKSC